MFIIAQSNYLILNKMRILFLPTVYLVSLVSSQQRCLDLKVVVMKGAGDAKIFLEATVEGICRSAFLFDPSFVSAKAHTRGLIGRDT